MGKIQMKKDMTVIDGHNILSTALSTCSDIRAFEIDIDLYNEEIQEFNAATLFFDRKINRLAIKEANTTVFVVYQGHELGCKGVFERKADAEKWVNALNNLDSTEKWHYEEKYLNIVEKFGQIVKVTKAIFDLYDGTIKSQDTLDWPTMFGDTVKIIKHEQCLLPAFGASLGRYVTMISSKLNILEVFQEYQKTLTDRYRDIQLEFEEPKNGDNLIKLRQIYPVRA
jgi:hypothetical protein